MAYTSDEAGQLNVYVRRFPSAEGLSKVSIAGGTQPRWRSDGKEMFYLAADGKLMAVEVKASSRATPSIELEAPVTLFDARISADLGVSFPFNYDVTGDGKRFLIITTAVAATSQPPLTVWINWVETLRK